MSSNATKKPVKKKVVKRAARGMSDCPIVADSTARQAANTATAKIKDNFPLGLSRPALRALVGAKLTRLPQLTRVTERQLSQLHGMGPKAIEILRVALRAQGKSFQV
jgi:hypothetical protein